MEWYFDIYSNWDSRLLFYKRKSK